MAQHFCLLLWIASMATGHPLQAVPADLGVSMSANPTDNLRPGQIIDLTITVTNYGSESVPVPFLYSSYFFDEFVLGLASNDCGLGFAVLDDEYSWSYLFLWYSYGRPDLAAGQSQVCHAKIALSPEAPSTVAFSFRLPDEYADPDPSNDSATVYLRRAIAPIPGDSALSRGLLITLLPILAAAGLAQRRLTRRVRMQ